MFQFEIGIDPVIAQAGPLALRWYSLAIMTGIITAVIFTRREFVRRGIPHRDFDMVAFFTVVGGIVGARLFHVLDHPGRFLDNPARILALQEGGLAIYGAVVGGFVTVWILARVYKLPFLPVIDAIAPGLVLAQAIGRIGCIINGDAWGAPTSSSFAFIYTNPDAMIPSSLIGVPTHPYPVYDLAMNLIIFGILLQLRNRPVPHGTIFAVFAAFYALGRFFISFVRQEQVWFWGLQEAQVVAIVVLIAAIAGLAWLFLKGDRAATPVVGH